MFGVLRTILALMVMVGHLTDKWQIGTYAVFAFYIISGYLMTLIMHEGYGYSASGRMYFALNRFLRLYPLYWVAALLSLVIVLWVGSGTAATYNPIMQLPQNLLEGLRMIGMMYIGLFPNEVKPNLVPTTWAITVELFFYAAICLGLSKHKKIVWLWLAVSAVYAVYCLAADLGWRYRYFPIMAASLPFSIGAMIYFLKREGYPSIDDSFLFKPITLSILLVTNSAVVLVNTYYFEFGFYVSLLLSVLLVYQLAVGEAWGKLSRKTDQLLGDYSYPIYLLHWQVGLAVSWLLFGEPIHDTSLRGIASLGCSIVVVVIISALMLRFVDRPFQRLRSNIKGSLAKP